MSRGSDQLNPCTDGQTSRFDGEAGITIREEFAARAMQALIDPQYHRDPRDIARQAVLHADALLEALY